MSLDLRPYLKELARGRHGARDMTREQARTVFDAIFRGDVDDLALGALLVALRVKNESADELAGMLDALAGHVRPLRMPRRRALPVLLPTYNGARKLPNLVPLLAMLLAREDIPVVLHGVAHEPQRVSTFEILEQLGHPAARTLGEAEAALDMHHLAAIPLRILSPALATLLDRRMALGVRNSGHTLAKLLLPAGTQPHEAFRVVPVTHPDFQALMRQHFAATPGHAFLMRGVEGEGVVRLHAPQPIEQVDPEGRLVTHLLPECAAPELPPRDATATAQWTREVIEGRHEVPAALARQVTLVVSQCRAALAERPSLRIVK